jgi:hypothetical protein
MTTWKEIILFGGSHESVDYLYMYSQHTSKIERKIKLKYYSCEESVLMNKR